MKRLTGTGQQMARMQKLQPTEPGATVRVGGNEVRIVPGGWPSHCEPAEHKGKYVARLFTLYHEYTDSGVDPIVLEPDEVGEFVQRIFLTAELPEVWQEAIGFADAPTYAEHNPVAP